MNPLSQIRIVMVHTTHPGNIGAAARAMKNMGLSDLVLVSPKVFPSGEANARASGADDILEAARVVGTLEEALRDRELVIGASARLRSIAWPQVDPKTAADKVIGSGLKTAILMGREHSGLTNEEMERCHFLLHIPSNPEYTSLNVAAALQVIAYELFARSLVGAPEVAIPPAERQASGEAMASFFGHLQTVLEEIGFLHPTKHEESILRRLRRIYNRAALEEQEVHLLRGILTKIQRQLKEKGSA
jgi:tRNA (cytidine32/uridine32-2'-O)-methyltransferase